MMDVEDQEERPASDELWLVSVNPFYKEKKRLLSKEDKTAQEAAGRKESRRRGREERKEGRGG